MHALAKVDYAIILGYLALSLIAGVIMTKRAGRSLEHYFLGGRSLPWWMLGVAGMANWFDLTGTMMITSFLYMLGPRGLYVEFRGGAGIVLIFMLAYIGKWHRRSGCMTGAEWMTYRFGAGKAAEVLRAMTALAWILLNVMMLAYLIRGASLFLGMFFPFPAMQTTLVIIAVSTLFTMSAGFYGVVLTDIVQSAIILAASVIIAVLAWHQIPDLASLGATARAVTGNAGWTDSQPAWHTPMPAGYEAYSPLIMVATFYLLRNILGGAGWITDSRYFGAKSDRDCGLQSFQQGVMLMFRWPLMIGFAVMGIYLVHGLFPDPTLIARAADLIHAQFPATTEPYWHDLTGSILTSPQNYPADFIARLHALLGDDWQGKLALVGYRGTVNPEQILPAVLLNVVPTGLKGMIVVAMFAAMMSCKNGMMNGASALFVKDIYQNFLRPQAANRELIIVSYASTLGIVVIGFYFGVAATSINTLWGWIVMSLSAGQIGPQVMRLYWWRTTAGGMILGTVLGMVGAVVQRMFWPGLSEPMQLVFMASISFGGTIIGSLVTAPTPRDVLVNFYRTTRPFGFWGPLRNEFQGALRAAIDRENRNDLIALPFTLLWLITMLLLPMQLVIKSYPAFWCTLPLQLLALAGMYHFWWKPLNRPSVVT